MVVITAKSFDDDITSSDYNVILNKVQNGTDTDINFYNVIINSTEVITHALSIQNIVDLTISGTFTDGTASVSSGAFTGVVSITDGTASWNSNSLSGFTSISATTLTDGTLSISAGAITSATTIGMSGLLTITSANALTITSDATSGTPIDINITGAMASGNAVDIVASDASNSRPLLRVTHNGTGVAGSFYRENAASGAQALKAYSNVACTSGTELVLFQLDSASSTDTVVKIVNDGTGHTLNIDSNGNTGYGIYLHSNNASRTDPLLFVREDNASAASYVAFIAHDGAANGNAILQLSNREANCAHINFVSTTTSNPTAPNEGDFWYDDTAHVFKYYNGTDVETIAVA
jgi:hypothetical protein